MFVRTHTHFTWIYTSIYTYAKILDFQNLIYLHVTWALAQTMSNFENIFFLFDRLFHRLLILSIFSQQKYDKNMCPLHGLAHPEFIHWAQSIVRVKCWILQEEDKRINVRKNAKIGNTKNKIFITWCIADNLLFQMAMRLLHWRVFQLVQHSKYINTHAHRYN